MSNLEQRLGNLESTVQRLERKIDRLLEMFGLEPSEDPDVKTEAEPPIVRRTLADVAADYPEVQAETVPVKQGWSEPPKVDKNDPDSVQALRVWLNAIDESLLSLEEKAQYYSCWKDVSETSTEKLTYQNQAAFYLYALWQQSEQKKEQATAKSKISIDWAEKHEAATRKLFEFYGESF